MADHTGSADLESSDDASPALVPMGQFLGRPPLPLDRAVVTVGSNDTCKLQLESRSVSRVHALLVHSPDGTYVADLCSRTGVLVNGRSVRDADLTGGDRIQIGRFTFRYRGGADETVVAAAPPLAVELNGELITIPGRTLLIGRRENADLQLSSDPDVSTTHAVLFQMARAWFVRDLGSRTGTRVNGEKIATQQRVEAGDFVQVGRASLHLTPAPPPAETAEEHESTALSLDADLPPIADLEPLDFSAIDSIEAAAEPVSRRPVEGPPSPTSTDEPLPLESARPEQPAALEEAAASPASPTVVSEPLAAVPVEEIGVGAPADIGGLESLDFSEFDTVDRGDEPLAALPVEAPPRPAPAEQPRSLEPEPPEQPAIAEEQPASPVVGSVAEEPLATPAVEAVGAVTEAAGLESFELSTLESIEAVSDLPEPPPVETSATVSTSAAALSPALEGAEPAVEEGPARPSAGEPVAALPVADERVAPPDEAVQERAAATTGESSPVEAEFVPPTDVAVAEPSVVPGEAPAPTDEMPVGSAEEPAATEAFGTTTDAEQVVDGQSSTEVEPAIETAERGPADEPVAPATEPKKGRRRPPAKKPVPKRTSRRKGKQPVGADEVGDAAAAASLGQVTEPVAAILPALALEVPVPPAVDDAEVLTFPDPEPAAALVLDSASELRLDDAAPFVEPAADPLSDTGFVHALEGFADSSTGPLVESDGSVPPVEAPAEIPAVASLADEEEFVAIPELDEDRPAGEMATTLQAEDLPTTEGAELPQHEFSSEHLTGESASGEPGAEALMPSTAEDQLSDEPALAGGSELHATINIDLAEEPAPDAVELGSEFTPNHSTETDLLSGVAPELPLTADTVELPTVSEPSGEPVTLPAAEDLLLGGVGAAVAATAAATQAGPGIFGFSFEGESFLQVGELTPLEQHSLDDIEDLPSPVRVSAAAEDGQASAGQPPGDGVGASEPSGESAQPVVAALPQSPTPITTLAEEIAVPPLAQPVRTPPRQRRALSTAFDGLSAGTRITGLVGGVSLNGQPPAGRGGQSVDVFSQVGRPIGAESIAEPASSNGFAREADPAPLSTIPPQQTMPPGSARANLSPAAVPAPLAGSNGLAGQAAAVPRPQPTPVAPPPPPPRRRRRWPLWGTIGLMFASLGAVWGGVYGLVPQAVRVTGTLNFANLTEQTEADQHAFEADQLARLHSNEVRTMARSILLAGGAPTGFTDDTIALGRALDRDGSAGFVGETLTVAVHANDPVEGRAQLDALLSALAKRDADLGDAQHRAAQQLSDATAAVATARDKRDSLRGELLTVRARGEDRPDAEQMAALQAASDRADRLLTLARGSRLDAQAALALLRPILPAGTAAEGNGGEPSPAPRDAQLTRLRWELGDLNRQISDLNTTRLAPVASPAGFADAGPASTPPLQLPDGTPLRPDTATDGLLTYLNGQVQFLTTALADPAMVGTGAGSDAARARLVELLSVHTHDLEQAEQTAQAISQLALDKLRTVQGRLDSARQATVKIDQLIGDIRAAETTLKHAGDDAAAAKLTADAAVAVAGDPAESVQTLSDRRPIYAGVLSGLILCLFSGMAINAMRAAPVALPLHPFGDGGLEPPDAAAVPGGVDDLAFADAFTGSGSRLDEPVAP